MSRIAIPSRDKAAAAAQPTLNAVYKQLGFVPNLHRLMSISPAALAGWVGLQGALSKTLDIKTCDGIVSGGLRSKWHQLLPLGSQLRRIEFRTDVAGRDRAEPSGPFERSQAGRSGSVRKEADQDPGQRGRRGSRSRAQGGLGRSADRIEIVALSAQFLLTNFMNNVADTDIDFPAVSPAEAA